MNDFITTESQFFSVKKVLSETLEYCIENKSPIFNALKYPALGILATSLIPFGSEFGIAYLLLIIVSAYFYNVFAVNCHRLILLNETSDNLTESMGWNKRNTNFLLTTFGLGIGTFVFMFPTFFILSLLPVCHGPDGEVNELYFYLTMIPIGYIVSRFSLALPAVAIDNESDFHRAWKIFSGNGWKLFFIISVIPLATGYIIENINNDFIIFKFLSALLGILVLIFEIMVLSSSYKQLNQIYENLK